MSDDETTTVPVPEPVARFARAINDGDTEAFVAAFTEDCFVDDWGRVLRGHDGVRGWAGSDAIGQRARIAFLEAHAEGDTVTTRFSWHSDRFNGESTGIFVLDGGLIAGFTIPPHH